MCWTRQMSQKYVLPHLSNAISPLTSMHCTKTISRSRMASFILVPRASISVGHVVGETGIFFNDILGREQANYRKLLSRLLLHFCSLTNALACTIKHAPWGNGCRLWHTASVLFLFFAFNSQCKARRMLYFAFTLQQIPAVTSRASFE